MKLVFASDSFKGSLSSERINTLLETAAGEAFANPECISLRMADGGEGTVDAIRSVRAGEDIPLCVNDAMRRPLRTRLFTSGDEAFVEAAATCGLALFKNYELNPLAASSAGVGACINHALFHNCKRITVALGGTCTNDGGMGCMRALGIRFLDQEGRELEGRGADLERVATIDESGLVAQARDAEFTIMSDVTNPLIGSAGATRVFGRQKGADGEMIDLLESGMVNYMNVIARTHPDTDFETPGFGAAGGLGMALSTFLGAKMTSGIETLLKWIDFDALIEDADLIVTGEGRIDGQSIDGKVISGITAHARRAGVPVAAICGTASLSDEQLESLGITRVIQTSAGLALEDALAYAEENYLQAARQLFSSIS